MIVKCVFTGREMAHYRRPDVDGKPWKHCMPFNANPRGILVHRIRNGVAFYDRNGEYSHAAVNYWCGNTTNGDGVSPVELPPEGRLLCVNCERRAVEAGEPTAAKLAGRHVCVGELRAFRLCCKNEEN
jgi:hypothetical protein